MEELKPRLFLVVKATKRISQDFSQAIKACQRLDGMEPSKRLVHLRDIRRNFCCVLVSYHGAEAIVAANPQRAAEQYACRLRLNRDDKTGVVVVEVLSYGNFEHVIAGGQDHQEVSHGTAA